MDNFQYYIRSHSVKSWNFSEIFQIPSGIILDCIKENPRLLSDKQENSQVESEKIPESIHDNIGWQPKKYQLLTGIKCPTANRKNSG